MAGLPRANPFDAAATLPALIAHGAGNSPFRARAAIAAGADLLEVDLWVHHGRFEARHERAIYPLPVLFEKWYLRRAPREPVRLDQLMELVEPPHAVFLDLKNGGENPAHLLRHAVAAEPGRRLFASSQQWPVLRAIAREAPSIGLFYSVDSRAQLDLVLAVAERDSLPLGVSCRHGHLTPGVVDALHGLGLAVVAWTVDEETRALELAAWGVEGITTHRVAALRTRLERSR